MFRYFPVLFAIASFSSVQVFHVWNQQTRGKTTSEKYVPPPKHINHLAFGYKESFADSLWIRAIQDFDVCQTEQQKAEKLVSPVEEVEPEQKEADPQLTSIVELVNKANVGRVACKKSWVYRMLDAVTELAPRFRIAYAIGAVSLSVVIDDYEGATLLYEKAFRAFPNDWKILYQGAYHFMFDKKDFKRAADLLARAEGEGAPFWLKSLAARLYTKTGQAELAIHTLLEYREQLKDHPEAIKDIDERIKMIRRAMTEG